MKLEPAPSSPGVHLPPPLLFVTALGAGLLLHRWLPLHLAPGSLRTAGVLAGWALIGSWAVLSAWAMLTFSRAGTAILPNRPAARLVTTGPYRLSRNPMYVGLSALHLGVSALVDSLWPVLLLPPVWLLLRFWVVEREERYLAAAFGGEYDAYRSRVRRWI